MPRFFFQNTVQSKSNPCSFRFHMLEFWFNPTVSMIKKIFLLLTIAGITLSLYLTQPLAFDAILMFLGTGIVFLICRYSKIHFLADHPNTVFYRLMTWIPIALLLALIFMQMKGNSILLPGAQGLGFMALAICLFSPLSLLNQNTQQTPHD